MTRARAALVSMFAFVAGIGATGCGSDGPPKVAVVGDSLVVQSTTYLTQQLRDRDVEPKVAGLSGSATCDLFGPIEELRDDFDPDVVAVSFSGNALGSCMRHADGSALSDAEYVDKYRKDTEHVIEMFDDDTPVYLVGAPVSGTPDERVARIYHELAAKRDDNVHYVDGGKYAAPHHTFAKTLPCMRGEPECTGPVIGGVRNNVVRAPDDAHFCPVDKATDEPCPVYSSGAYRFARAITEAVTARS
jgi:hypothetical protein